MKKVFSIIIAAIVIASGIRVSIDRHYCGGELAGIKLSLTGKLASCGMENPGHICPKQSTIDKKCCEDQLTFYGVTSKYLPEYFRLSHPMPGEDIPAIPLWNVLFRPPDVSDLNSWVLPPGVKLKTDLTLSKICVFRI